MNRLINRIILLTYFLSSILLSQDASAQINRIKIQGNERFSADDIIRISNIYPGMEIKSDEIQKGINRLWDLNRFNDIKIILDNETIDGIDIIIQLDEADILNEISISGNKKISKNKIEEMIELEKVQILTKKNIFDSRLRVINEYKSRGFYNVQIIESTEDSNLDYASNLIFKITEGNKLRINKINIDGKGGWITCLSSVYGEV